MRRADVSKDGRRSLEIQANSKKNIKVDERLLENNPYLSTTVPSNANIMCLN